MLPQGGEAKRRSNDIPRGVGPRACKENASGGEKTQCGEGLGGKGGEGKGVKTYVHWRI